MNSPIEDEPDTATKRLDLDLWRRLFRYARAYPRQLSLFLLSGMVVALADVGFPLVTRRVIDDLAQGESEGHLLGYAAAYMGLTLMLVLGVSFFVRMGGYLRTGISHDIRRDGFDRLQELSFSFFDRRPVGWLMARMTADCERLSNILAWGSLDLAWGVALMVTIGAVMLTLAPVLALQVLAVVPVVAWVSLVFQRRMLASSRLVRKTNSRLTASFNESLGGVRTTKVFRRETANADEFHDLSAEMQGASVLNRAQAALYLPLVTTLASLATAVALVLGGFDVLGGSLSLGTWIAFLGYAALFFQPVLELAAWFAELQMGQASAERVLGLIDEVPEIRDEPGTEARTTAPRVSRIEFRDVGFAYGTGPPVLEGIRLSVQAGESVALVGSTGGGKSTLVNLLARFYEPTAGSLLLDGVDYRELSLSSWRRQLGIVLQTPHLFSGSLAANLRYGKSDATEAELREVLGHVGALEFVDALPAGLATEVGEGGVRLSTGEKQLISFARALLSDPHVLIMDEATSSLDTETEGRIQRGLARMLEGRTSFVIAHRLSTIRAADRILVIEGGRILEQGSHRELLELRGRYYALWARQGLRESGRTADEWAGEPKPGSAT